MGKVLPTLVPLSVAILAVLGGAASTGLLVPDAEAQVARRRDDEKDGLSGLLVVPSDDRTIYLADHSSHRSHSSHSSHYSGGGGGGGGGDYGGDYSTPAPAPAPAPPPPRPKVARVSFIAFPGGRISIDGRPVGTDATGTLTLEAGMHVISVQNRFLGEESRDVYLADGQAGVIEINW